MDKPTKPAAAKQPAAPPSDRPVINIDADPDNANWIRILAKRREEREAAARGEKTEPPVIEDTDADMGAEPDGDVDDVELVEPDSTQFAKRGWSAKKAAR